MATTIKLKSGSGAPLAGDLVAAEPAFDLTNKRLYTENASGTVIEVGTNPSTIDINAGTIDGTVIGGASAAAGTFTTFTSTGIDDNATSTAITIDSSQNVGIGTASPNSYANYTTLTLRGTTGSEVDFENSSGTVVGAIYNTATNLTIASDFTNAVADSNIVFTCDGSERMRIDSSGNVGIGTTNPLVPLHVETSGTSTTIGDNAAVTLRSKAAGRATTLQFSDGANANWISALSGNLGFATNNTERMRIDSSGNLLVGKTTTATSTVGGVWSQSGVLQTTTDGSVALYLNRETSDGDILEFRKDNTTVGSIGTEGGDLAIGNDDAGIQFVNGNEHFRPFSMASNASTDGLMDIGSSSKRFKDLYLSGGVNFDGASGNTLYKSGSDLILTNRAAATLIVGTSNTERMRIDSSGVLMLGRSTTTVNQSNFGFVVFPSGLLNTSRDVTGTSGVVQFYGNAGQFRTMGDGDAQNTNNSYGAISDERLKSNIVDASSQIDDIMAVQVRSYTLNETGATHIGVVAQELEASGMSGLVKTDDEGMKSVKYSVLYMKAIKALQEAVTRIETLEAEVAALKGA